MTKQKHCKNIAESKRELTFAKAIDGIRSLKKANLPITLDALSAHSGVSRSWLYKEPVIKELVNQYQTGSPDPDLYLYQVVKSLEKALTRLEKLEKEMLFLKQSYFNSIDQKKF